MFDFLSTQILSIAAPRRAGGADASFADARHLAEREMSRAPTPRPVATEDQVLISGAARVPPPPIPVKPGEPTDTGNRVRSVLRRLRGFGRRSGQPDPHDPDREDRDASDQPAAGHHLDRWA